MSDTTARLESDEASIVGQFGACKAGDKVTLTITGEITEHSTDKSDIKVTGPVGSILDQKKGPRHHLSLRMNVKELSYSKGPERKSKPKSPGVAAILQNRGGY